MNFDYYAATLPASVSHCKSSLLFNHPSIFSPEKPITPYKNGLRHVEEDFRLYWGGGNPLPFFTASGRSAVLGSEFCRRVYPDHRVARVDVATDFDEAGGFERIRSLIHPIARAAGVAVLFIGDPDGIEGRTLYYGSKSSDVRVVLYEKGKQMRGKGDMRASETWVRVELRVRPRKDRKARAASLSASQLWGMAKWSSVVARDVLSTVIPFVPDQSMRITDCEKAVNHMFTQYARSLRSHAELHGGSEKLHEMLDQALAG